MISQARVTVSMVLKVSVVESVINTCICLVQPVQVQEGERGGGEEEEERGC
jgi:hypothetical protein